MVIGLQSFTTSTTLIKTSGQGSIDHTPMDESACRSILMLESPRLHLSTQNLDQLDWTTGPLFLAQHTSLQSLSSRTSSKSAPKFHITADVYNSYTLKQQIATTQAWQLSVHLRKDCDMFDFTNFSVSCIPQRLVPSSINAIRRQIIVTFYLDGRISVS